MAVPVSASGRLGVDYTRADTDAEFALGTRDCAEDGAEFVYCQANGAITANYVCHIDETWQADMIETTISGSAFGDRVGVAPAALADNEYGWIQVLGTCDAIQVAASAAANVLLNTTATAGQLDDNNLAGSENIRGLVLTTARSTTDGTAPGTLSYPTVGGGATDAANI